MRFRDLLYWFLFGIDCIAAAVAVFYFFLGLGDGTVSSFNITIWMLLLGGIGAVLGGGHVMRRAGQVWFANVVLAILGLPSLFAGLLMLLLIANPPRWN